MTDKALIWIDDLRDPPNDDWLLARTSAEGKRLVASCTLQHRPFHISFDHDLGGVDTAMDVVAYLELLQAAGIPFSMTWEVHSANPVGRDNLVTALARMEERSKSDE